jgi:hypothetical protein
MAQVVAHLLSKNEALSLDTVLPKNIWVVLGFELRASCLLDWHCYLLTHAPSPFGFSYFSDRLSCFLPR